MGQGSVSLPRLWEGLQSYTAEDVVAAEGEEPRLMIQPSRRRVGKVK